MQQKLVLESGWTPVVGFDPRVGPPSVLPGAVLVDFNAQFQLPTMWLHFPLEFSFMFCERLAFWHADLLVRRAKMQAYARLFADLPDGAMAATWADPGWRSLLRPYEKRFWEVMGCNTRGSSESQFLNGCGWWNTFQKNPNNSAAEQHRRRRYYWDSGTGIYYWNSRLNGTVIRIPEREIDEGHCTSIKRADYIRKTPINAKRDLSQELSLNNDLARVCASLGIEDLAPGRRGRSAQAA